MIVAVLVKRGGRATLNLSEPGVLSDYSRLVRPDEVFDGVPVSAWTDGVHRLQHYHVSEPTPEPPPRPKGIVDDTVSYSAERIVAYFNDHDRSTHPSMATWCKVWTPGGKMQIIRLKESNTHGVPSDG